jgi:aspartate racemase
MFQFGQGMSHRRIIGVLGGMGPLATVDFMQKVISATPAACDQDHVPLIVYSVPQIPDRVGAVLAGTDEPFPAILAGLRTLETAGAELIAMPCNTAHAWYDRLEASSGVEILHMADAVVRRLGRTDQVVALMATSGTLRAGFYQRYLATAGCRVLVPSSDIQSIIARSIAAVKTGAMTEARCFFEEAAASLIRSGADRLLMACTELPLAAYGTEFEQQAIDATVCLAEACVAFSTGTQDGATGATGT